MEQDIIPFLKSTYVNVEIVNVLILKGRKTEISIREKLDSDTGTLHFGKS
ncbi:MAG: hypothetical protein KJ864_02620 [Candidatus Omnitrophica bacterium]|nr:hypothetical protein [Candidatus Omnitrophota bacterium]